MKEYTNYSNSENLYNWSKESYNDMLELYEKKIWNGVIRRAQEVIELSMKMILRIVGVDCPKTHDPSNIFFRVIKEKKLPVNLNEGFVSQIKETSKWLQQERAPAFYYEKKYTKNEANLAYQTTKKLFSFIQDLYNKIK